jgi:hypothetical protein
MRDDCPVEQCRVRAQYANPSVIYSSARKAPVPTPIMTLPTNSTPTNVSFPQLRQFGTHDKGQSDMYISQHTNPTPSRPSFDEASAAMLASASSGGEMAEMELQGDSAAASRTMLESLTST